MLKWFIMVYIVWDDWGYPEFLGDTHVRVIWPRMVEPPLSHIFDLFPADGSPPLA